MKNCIICDGKPTPGLSVRFTGNDGFSTNMRLCRTCSRELKSGKLCILSVGGRAAFGVPEEEKDAGRVKVVSREQFDEWFPDWEAETVRA